MWRGVHAHTFSPVQQHSNFGTSLHRLAVIVAQGGYKYHQYQVVGRHLPTEKEPEPTIYRMKLWATDPVRAKSKFWCELCQMQRWYSYWAIRGKNATESPPVCRTTDWH